MKKLLLLTLLFAGAMLFAAECKMGEVKIVMPKTPKKSQLLAEEELKFHLNFVAGSYKPGNEFTMYIGQAPAGAPKAKKDQGIFVIDGKNIYFYGDDGNDRRPKYGTMMAIYTFFQKYYNLRYLRPGNEWIIGKKGALLNLPEKETTPFMTKLQLISLRQYGPDRLTNHNGFAPKELWTSDESAKKTIEEETLWRYRNRLFSRHGFKYGHAFRAWQKRFLETKPEYFGLSPYGTRGLPRHQDHLAKLCLSNEAVIDQIIKDWQDAGAGPYLNLCPNDGTPGYCFCENCLKLDADLPGERFHNHKTDRYLNFWNRVIAKARKIRPDVTAVVYIYSYYRFPPRREKIQFPENTLCGMVPSMTEDVEDAFKQWQKAGMTRCFFRPNYLSYKGAMPRGLDRFYYDTFKLAAGFDFIGADYDAVPNRRPCDLDFYVVARLLDNPEEKYETIIDEYCSGYMEAAPVVKEYYARLRTRGEKALKATADTMQKKKLSVLDDSELIKYAVGGHTEKDLLEDIEVLKKGLKLNLSPVAKERLNQLIVCAEHYLHTYRFYRAVATGKDIEKYAKILHDFRIANNGVMKENFGTIYFRAEQNYWKQVAFYNQMVSKDNSSPADPAAGWRASFDGPGLAEWNPRNGYVKVTDKTASFDKYSVELKPVSASGDTIGIWRRLVPVTPGATYKLSFDFKFDNVPHGAIRVRSDKGKVLSRTVPRHNGKGFWIPNEVTFKIPADCKAVDIYVNIGKGDANARAYVDNIVFTRQDKAEK